MAIEILADLTKVRPSSPEWLEIRKLGIGGSDTAAVCGVGRRTAYEVWADKVNPSVVESDEPEYMRWGKLLEGPVRDEFTQRTGIEVHTLPNMVRNTEYPWMLANVDGVTGPTSKLTGVYEGKTTRFADQWSENADGSVNVPLPYKIQGIHYLAVLGLERVHFACLIGGQELRIAELEVDQTLVDDLVEIEEAFWRSVIDREPPPVAAGDVPVLKKRWAPESGKEVVLPATFVPALKTRAQRKAQIASLQKDVDQIDAEIMALMGDAETAVVTNRGVVATWKAAERTTIDTKALREAHPDIAKEFSKTTVSRRFLPKEVAE